MKYSATITVDGDSDNISKLFESEEKEFQNKRARYSIDKKDKETNFVFEADDAVALRAVLNSVAKNLVVYEKTK